MTTLTPELQRELNARTAPGWRPNPGDVITGEIVAMTRAESEWGPYPRLVLDLVDTTTGARDGMTAVHAFHSTLKSGLAELHAAGRLAVGDLVTIAYAGRRQARNGNPYELYTVLAGDGRTPAAGTDDITDLLG